LFCCAGEERVEAREAAAPDLRNARREGMTGYRVQGTGRE
jgi:hypothetical protein